MDLGDIVLTNMNQFAGLTAKIIDELLKLIDSLLCTNAERKELKAFLESEKSLLENGDVNSDRSIFSSTTLDAKALSLKLEANGVKHKVLYEPTTVDGNEITTKGIFIIENKDLEKAKDCVLALSRERSSRLHLSTKELYNMLSQKNSNVYKIENVSHSELVAIQSIAKRQGRQFYFASESRTDNELLNVYCSEKDAQKLNLAMAEISLSKNIYGGKTVLLERNIERETQTIDYFVACAQNKEDLYLRCNEDIPLEIKCSNGTFSVYEGNKVIYAPDKNLFKDNPQEYYSELMRYAKNFNHPIILTPEERNSDNIIDICIKKASELYPKIPPLSEEHKKVLASFGKMAIANQKSSGIDADFKYFINVAKESILSEIENVEERQNLEAFIDKNINFDAWSSETLSLNSEEARDLAYTEDISDILDTIEGKSKIREEKEQTKQVDVLE